ncbi:MAG TPA: Abi family protein, partial [Chitinophagaceae bacterium]|nr:Abi family protein [Chitinophagaceae bacterium]
AKKCRKSSEPYLKEYTEKYKSPALPPSWLMMEIISFGEASSLFKNIASIEYRSEIANYFKTYDNIFRSWIGSIATVRNLCAHNQNLAGHKISFAPSLPVGQNHELLVTLPPADFIEEVIDTRKLYATLCSMQSILDALHDPTNFKESLLVAIDEYAVDLSLYGFTPNWRNEPLWQL